MRLPGCAPLCRGGVWIRPRVRRSVIAVARDGIRAQRDPLPVYVQPPAIASGGVGLDRIRVHPGLAVMQVHPAAIAGSRTSPDGVSV
jgi:hypothetical protein